MIRFFYLTQFNLLSGRAHVYNVTKTCEALSTLGDINVTLVTSNSSVRGASGLETYFSKHNVERESRFNVESLSSFSNSMSGRLKVLFANVTLVRFLFGHSSEIDVVYFRDHLLYPAIWVAKRLLGKRVVYESHYVLTRSHGQFLTEASVRLADAVVAISDALKERYAALNKDAVVAYCGAAEKERYDYARDKFTLREKLGLPQDKKIIGYTGNVGHTGNFDHYRLELIVEALPLLPEDVMFIGAGERSDDAKWLRDRAEELKVQDRVIILPQPAREQVPNYQRAFDVLVLPEREQEREGDSPLKMFEYLASGRPIVASETKVMGEVLSHKKNALLVPKSTPQDWASTFIALWNDRGLEEQIVAQALSDAQEYTWKKRAARIGELIKRICRQ